MAWKHFSKQDSVKRIAEENNMTPIENDRPERFFPFVLIGVGKWKKEESQLLLTHLQW